MTIKQTIVMVAVAFGLMTGTVALIPTTAVFAQVEPEPTPTPTPTPDDEEEPPADGEEPPADGDEATDNGQPAGLPPEKPCDSANGDTCCDKVKTSIITGEILCGTGSDNSSAENSTIWHLLIAALNILTAGIGIAAVGGIVYGALLYTTAEDRPDQTKKAIGVITNVVIGIVAYGLMFVLLNFLIPGGIFT